jgi:hypothetical protein
MNLPLTRQGVLNLDLLGRKEQRNKRSKPLCSRGLAPHSYLIGACKECGEPESGELPSSAGHFSSQ